MKGSDIITTVRRDLVEANAAFWGSQELLDLLNDAERDFNNKTRILEGISYSSTITGQPDYTLPSNWLNLDVLLFNNPKSDGNPQWSRIEPTTVEKQAQENPNFLSNEASAGSVPRKYYIWGQILYLTPTPVTDGNSNIAMFYKAKPIPLHSADDPINVDDSFKDTLVNYILWKCYKKEKEPVLAAQHQAEYVLGIREGRRWVKKKEQDMRYKLDLDSPRPFSLGSGATRGFDPF
jgi:hypothetical protein